jgi:hypothetical protein
MKRLLLILPLAAAIGLGIVSSAPAGVGIADDPCPTAGGENTNTCPTGTVGEPYSIRFHEAEGSGCGPGLQTFAVDSGNFPPGLVLESSGQVRGTPTEAGTFTFYVRINEPKDYADWCQGSQSEKRFTIPINPAIPKLTIGPEATSPGTTGTPYSLQMTATLSEPKTWSIVSGTLPPGLQINSATGLISGTPTAAGSFQFQVLAKMVSDARSDTKWLTIAVRQPLKITGTGLFGGAGTPIGGGELVRTEVGVPFLATLEVSGGSGEYTWAIAQGTLPPGVTMANGNFLGRPTEAGIYRVTISAADTEGRTATFPAVVTVAERLAVATQRMKPGKVGRTYRAKLVATGGVLPKKWKKAGGKLPKGLRLDRKLGVVKGKPMKAGRYRVVFEVSDALGVKSKRAFRITVAPTPKKRG